jgi:hypothetical protein
MPAEKIDEEKYAAQLRHIFGSPEFMPFLKAIRQCNLPDWWLAGGAVRNTVWKKLYGEKCSLEIKDFDIAFFDRHTNREVEARARAALNEQFPELIFDVKNQASFGVWRDWHFVFESTEDGIAHWLHTATAVGVRLDSEDRLEIFAPYGLADLFTGFIRTTPYNEMTEAADKKAQSFMTACPRLKLID